MRGNEFLDKLELIDPILIEAADELPKQKKTAWLKWSGLAACLCVVAASVFALTAHHKRPLEPAPDPNPIGVATDGPSDHPDRPQEVTSEAYSSLEELLDYLRDHDGHRQSDAQNGKGGYSTAHAAMTGADTVSYQSTVYQIDGTAGVGIYQSRELIGTVGTPADWLFVAGQRLVTVWVDCDAGELDPEYWVKVNVFDLSDPAHPQKLDTFTQLGDLTACWMAGDQLYLLTDDGVCACGYSRLSNLEDYKPQLFHGEEQIPWPEEDVSILGKPSHVSYIAATRIDTERLEVVGKRAYYGDIEDVYYGEDWLALVTQTATEHAHTLQDVYTFNGSLNFIGKVDMAAVFGLEKTLTWSEEPLRETYYPEVKAVDCSDGVWRMVGQSIHRIGPTWYSELFAVAYDPEGEKPTVQTLQLPEEQFDIDDVVWEEDRAIISAGFVQLDPYETGTRLAFAQFDKTEPTLLSSDILCDRVTGIDMMYSYGTPLGEIQPFISLGEGLYLRYNGMPDGFDLYDLSDSEAPKCLYRSQGAMADLPEGGRLDFDNRVLDEHTVAVKLIAPGPDGNYFKDATSSWVIVRVRLNETIPIILEESPRYPVEGTDPVTLR